MAFVFPAMTLLGILALVRHPAAFVTIKGAGFYVDATTEGWSENYKMYTYITAELPEIVSKVATQP